MVDEPFDDLAVDEPFDDLCPPILLYFLRGTLADGLAGTFALEGTLADTLAGTLALEGTLADGLADTLEYFHISSITLI